MNGLTEIFGYGRSLVTALGIGRTQETAGVFDPTTIPSLAHRWRTTNAASRYSDLGGTVAASSGDPLGVLTDEIGGADYVAPSTGARPTLGTVGSTVVAQFDGVDDYLEVADADLSLTAGTVVTILRTYDSGASAAGLLDNVIITNTPRTRIQQQAGARWGLYLSGDSFLGARVTPDGEWCAVSIAVDRAADTWRFWENNVLSGESTSSDYLHGFAGLTLGARRGGSLAENYYVAEQLVFDAVLTQDEIQDLQSYAADTYGADLGIRNLGEDGFDPTAYGSVISYHTARHKYYEGGSDPQAIVGGGPDLHQINFEGSTNTPTYRASGPTFEFDGNDYFVASEKAPWDSLHQGEGSVVVRANFAPPSEDDAIIFFGNATEAAVNVGVTCMVSDFGTRERRVILYLSNGTDLIYETDAPSVDTGIADDTTAIIAWTWDATDARLYLDGTLLGTFSKGAGAFSGAASTDVPHFWSGPSGRFDHEGDSSDMIVFSDKLDATAISNLTSDLEAEYV